MASRSKNTRAVPHSSTADASRDIVPPARAKRVTQKKTSSTAGSPRKVVRKRITVPRNEVSLPTGSFSIPTVLRRETTPEYVDIVRELPARYDDTRIVIMVRDPHWCCCYWDVSEADIEKGVPANGLHLVIRRIDNTRALSTNVLDIHLGDRAGSWYFNLGMPGVFFGELGYFCDGSFIVIARSHVFSMPRMSVSDVIDEDWMPLHGMGDLLYLGEHRTEATSSMLNMFRGIPAMPSSSVLTDSLRS